MGRTILHGLTGRPERGGERAGSVEELTDCFVCARLREQIVFGFREEIGIEVGQPASVEVRCVGYRRGQKLLEEPRGDAAVIPFDGARTSRKNSSEQRLPAYAEPGRSASASMMS